MTRASTTRDVETENRLKAEIAESEYWMDRLSNTPDAQGMMSLDAQRRARENVEFHRQKIERLKAELAAMQTPISSKQASIPWERPVLIRRKISGLRQKMGLTDDPATKAKCRAEIERLVGQLQAKRDAAERA